MKKRLRFEVYEPIARFGIYRKRDKSFVVHIFGNPAWGIAGMDTDVPCATYREAVAFVQRWLSRNFNITTRRKGHGQATGTGKKVSGVRRSADR